MANVAGESAAVAAALAARNDLAPEHFVQRKRCEANHRDLSCKAVCKIKKGLRQPGAQKDGNPFVPEEWEAVFKPQLGPYLKFLLGRPDQFRVMEGGSRGKFKVENITLNKLVKAPAIVKGKGKGKFGKGDGKDKGKGTFKGKGKDKGKGKGKDKGKAKGWGKFDAFGEGNTGQRVMGLSHSRWANEAEDENPQDEEEQQQTEREDEGQDTWAAGAEDDEQANDAVGDDAAQDGDQAEEDDDEAPEGEDAEDDETAAAKSEEPSWSPAIGGPGSFIKSLLGDIGGGGLFSAAKRPRFF